LYLTTEVNGAKSFRRRLNVATVIMKSNRTNSSHCLQQVLFPFLQVKFLKQIVLSVNGLAAKLQEKRLKRCHAIQDKFPA